MLTGLKGVDNSAQMPWGYMGSEGVGVGRGRGWTSGGGDRVGGRKICMVKPKAVNFGLNLFRSVEIFREVSG